MQRSVRPHLVIALLFIILSAGHAQAYYLEGELNLYAVGAEQRYHQVYNMRNVTSMDDDVWVTGWDDPLNRANGAFKVDLASASVGTYAYADNGYDVAYINSASAQSKARLEETLYFVVLPGTYDEDLYVHLSGELEGEMTVYHTNTTDPLPIVQLSYQFSLSGNLGGDSFDSGGTTLDGYRTVDESYTLDVLLLRAGEYMTTQVITMTALASMMSLAAVQNHNVDNDHCKADFLNTGKFTSLAVPDGVTWTSSSGVFLTNAGSTVPEPGSVLLFLAGLAGLAGFLRLRRVR